MTDTSDLERQARAQAADLGRKAKEAVADTVRDAAGTAQAQAAQEVQATADAAGAAADAFAPGSVQAQAAQMVAGQLEDAARRVRSLEFDQTMQDVTAFARRNPLLFLSAAALTGFAATRFLKARDPAASALRGQEGALATSGGGNNHGAS
ncbi:hypothetical protein [Leisingera daeponensis]|uniref:hypothetical protein n=1 Tax=Leisingera daeponensis TaxID=405746 RepID=UPI001C9431A5|nr:hypothetical protein [Leisingera daeponensis]MBY6058041.1 hypothetical protein [Leisingera daeponensis]